MRNYDYEAEYTYDENKICLFSEKTDQKTGRRLFELQTHDPDSDQEKLFVQIVYDWVAQLVQNHVILYGTDYPVKKRSQKHFWRKKPTPCVFHHECQTATLKQELMESTPPNTYFMDYFYDYIETRWGKIVRIPSKELLLLQEKIDMELFIKFDTTYAPLPAFSGRQFWIFPESSIEWKASTDETITFYRERVDVLIDMTMHITLPRIYFTIDESKISIEEMIVPLHNVLEKYGKYLEVTL